MLYITKEQKTNRSLLQKTETKKQLFFKERTALFKNVSNFITYECCWFLLSIILFTFIFRNPHLFYFQNCLNFISF
eukprot:UN07120